LNHNRLREVRENRLISVAELARRAGISPLTITRIEKGAACRLETKRKILGALGLKPLERDTIFPEN
jgi:transcriptional regulator with XRE-family HTH domain